VSGPILLFPAGHGYYFVSLRKTPWRFSGIRTRQIGAMRACILAVSGHFLAFCGNDGIRVVFQDAKRRG